MNKQLLRLFIAAIVVSLLGHCAWAEDYSPGVLISVQQLEQMAGSPKSELAVLDVRSKESQRRGSIPGAIPVGGFFDFRPSFGNDGEPSEPQAEDALHKLLGQHAPAQVVVLGEATDPTTARAWWQLRQLGVDQAIVLNGGWRAWQAANGAIESATDKSPMVGDYAGPIPTFRVKQQERFLVRGAEVRKLLTMGKTPTLLDARSHRECAAGMIPGAKRLEWSELVDGESGKLLPADELRAKFTTAGINPKEPTISYCRSGGRASVLVLALAALGSEQVANYYGSWNEWSKLPDAPVEYPTTEATP